MQELFSYPIFVQSSTNKLSLTIASSAHYSSTNLEFSLLITESDRIPITLQFSTFTDSFNRQFSRRDYQISSRFALEQNWTLKIVWNFLRK